MTSRYKGRFIIAEGIDGSGKGTCVSAMVAWAEEMGLEIFDMEVFCKKHHRLPDISEIKEDVIISQEPTYSPFGKAIRDILTKEKGYSAQTLAHAFALDREIYYKKIILPARKLNKFVFQERSVVSTLCYQGLMQEGMTEYVLGLEGNNLALRNSADLIIVVDCDVGTALERVKKRSEAKGIPISLFETENFLTRVNERFHSNWLKELLDTYSTNVMFIENGKNKTHEKFKHEIMVMMSKMRL